jgi:hypothetical protein
LKKLDAYSIPLKNSFQDELEEVYKQLLAIFQKYQHQIFILSDAYALFSTSSDLIEDFKRFLPEPSHGIRHVTCQDHAATFFIVFTLYKWLHTLSNVIYSVLSELSESILGL